MSDESSTAVMDVDDETGVEPVEWPAGSGDPPPGSRRRAGAVAGAVLLVAALVGGLAWQRRPGPNPAIASSHEITADVLESRYGVRLDVVALLASGGLLELRLQVIDADKATALFGEVEDMPMLAVEGTNAVLESAKGMKHQLVLLDGAAYFLLYTNVDNVVHEGSTVAFVLNGERVSHLVVKK